MGDDEVGGTVVEDDGGRFGGGEKGIEEGNFLEEGASGRGVGCGFSGKIAENETSVGPGVGEEYGVFEVLGKPVVVGGSHVVGCHGAFVHGD